MIFILPALLILFIHLLRSGFKAVLSSPVELYLQDRLFFNKMPFLLKLKAGPSKHEPGYAPPS